MLPPAAVSVAIALAMLLEPRLRPSTRFQDIASVALVYLPPFLLAGWVVRLRLTGRWTGEPASLGLALGVAQGVLLAAIHLAAVNKQDFLEWGLAASGAISPAVLFVALAAYNVMTFGARYANREGRLAPRTGRSLIYFGTILWLLSALLFTTSLRAVPGGEPNEIPQTYFSLISTFGIVFLGPPYLAWIVWRRRERLMGVGPLASASGATSGGQAPSGVAQAAFTGQARREHRPQTADQASPTTPDRSESAI